MTTLLVNFIGLLLIFFIAWWFWFKPKSGGQQEFQSLVDIIVENGVYAPSIVKAKVGEPITLNFIRKDTTPCSAVVVFADFNISEELPVGQHHEIKLIPKQKGQFDFTCEMAMYRGTLMVD